MKAMRSTRRHWTDWYPVQVKLLADALSGAEDVLFVDVGGGKGHDLEKFSQRFPAARGRLILQDLPQTLDEVADLDGKIELLPHDFFRAQPVRGQRLSRATVWMKSVLTLCAPRRSNILHPFRLPQLG